MATPECVNLLYDYMLEYNKGTRDSFFTVLTHKTTLQLLNLPPKDARDKLDMFSVKITDKYFKWVTKAVLKSDPVAEIKSVVELRKKDYAEQIHDEMIEKEKKHAQDDKIE